MDGRLTVQMAECSAKQQVTNHRACEETKTIGSTQQDDDGFFIGSQPWREEGQNNLDRRNAENDERRRPCFLACVEDAQVQQHDGVRNQREGREGQRPTQDLGGLARELQVGEQTHCNRAAEGGEERDDWHQRDHGQAGTDGQVANHRLIVAVGRVAGQARHDGGQQCHTDDAVGHLQQQPCLLVNHRGGLGGRRGDIGGDEVTDLGDCHVGDNRDAHTGELLDAVVDTPQRTQIYARALEVRNHNRCLNNDTQGGAKPQKQDVRIGE